MIWIWFVFYTKTLYAAFPQWGTDYGHSQTQTKAEVAAQHISVVCICYISVIKRCLLIIIIIIKKTRNVWKFKFKTICILYLV
jgi:hypothetical protein